MLKITTTSKHHPLHARRRAFKPIFGTQRFLAALEGVEGGFAIGASIIVALSIAGLERELLIISAVVSIIVSGFNSASVKYSSEHYLDELDGREKKSAFAHYFVPAFIEFACYVLLSFASVVPMLIFKDVQTAVVACVALTMALMFVAGLWRGYMLHMSALRDGIETLLLGTGIITIGLISGLVINSL